MIRLRRAPFALLLAAAALVTSGPASPQQYPAKPVKLIALKSSEVEERLQNDGSLPAGGTPEQFLARIKKEIEVWRKVVNDAGIKAE